jgi:hypothetical protein
MEDKIIKDCNTCEHKLVIRKKSLYCMKTGRVLKLGRRKKHWCYCQGSEYKEANEQEKLLQNLKYLIEVKELYEDFLIELGAKIETDKTEEPTLLMGKPIVDYGQYPEQEMTPIYSTRINIQKEFVFRYSTDFRSKIDEKLLKGGRIDLLKDRVKEYYGRKVIFVD